MRHKQSLASIARARICNAASVASAPPGFVRVAATRRTKVSNVVARERASLKAFRAAEAEADVRTTIDTARLHGANPFNVIVSILA